jgi:NAD(P)-dependent dehydrogenase (short-subunit alcohol dehydrogenase family)
MPDAISNSLDLTGSVVIVTGGTKGVGRGIAARFLQAGADVVVTARNEPENPVAVEGRTAAFTGADVRDPDQAQAVVGFAVERFGRIDAVVNNAGGSPPAEAASASPRFSESIIRLNLLAPLHLAQAANAVMQEQSSGGSIVNIASVSGVRPSPGTAAYGAAKAGLLSLTTSLAMEWAPRVRVNAVTPGYIETEQSHLHYGDEQGVAAVAGTIPLGRMGTPTDIGDACLFLVSPLANYITGANLLVHGGGEPPPFLSAGNADRAGSTKGA